MHVHAEPNEEIRQAVDIFPCKCRGPWKLIQIPRSAAITTKDKCVGAGVPRLRYIQGGSLYR